MLITPFPCFTFVYPDSRLELCFSDLQAPFFIILPFKELLRKENIVIAHFNWPRGNRLAALAHPEVESVFHCSEIALFMEQLQMIMRALLSTLGSED